MLDENLTLKSKMILPNGKNMSFIGSSVATCGLALFMLHPQALELNYKCAKTFGQYSPYVLNFVAGFTIPLLGNYIGNAYDLY